MIESRLMALLKSESESRLDSMIESMPVAIAIYDRDDRFLRANTRYMQTFLPFAEQPPAAGSTFAEVLDAVEAQGVRMTVHGETADWKRLRLELRQRNAGFYEIRLSTGIWLACREVRASDGSLLATFTDITQLKEREDTLALHTGVLRSTLESIDEGVAVFDRNGHLIACSEAYFHLLRTACGTAAHWHADLADCPQPGGAGLFGDRRCERSRKDRAAIAGRRQQPPQRDRHSRRALPGHQPLRGG
jgi:PAS domain-containing protein